MAGNNHGSLDRADMRFIRRCMKAPLLSREREQELALAWRDRHDQGALHELILAYSRLVVAAAVRLRGYGLPLGDLIQEGNIGLMEAATRFDPDRAIRFSTYAGWWIRAAMQDHILRNWSIVRTGTTAAQKSLFFNLRRLRVPPGRSLAPDHERGRARPHRRSPRRGPGRGRRHGAAPGRRRFLSQCRDRRGGRGQLAGSAGRYPPHAGGSGGRRP